MTNSTSPRPRLQGSITLPANKLVTQRRSSLAKQRSKLGRVDGSRQARSSTNCSLARRAAWARSHSAIRCDPMHDLKPKRVRSSSASTPLRSPIVRRHRTACDCSACNEIDVLISLNYLPEDAKDDRIHVRMRAELARLFGEPQHQSHPPASLPSCRQSRRGDLKPSFVHGDRSYRRTIQPHPCCRPLAPRVAPPRREASPSARIVGPPSARAAAGAACALGASSAASGGS